MRTRTWLALAGMMALATAWGCGGDDSSTDASGGASNVGGTGGASGGTGGGNTGGTGGASGMGGGDTGGTGGAAGAGGTGGGDTGGTGGAAGAGGTGGAAGAGGTGGAAGAGGTGGAAGAGGTGGAPAYWTDTYNPNGSPNPSSGEHNAGKNCQNCHTSGNIAWLFGGTVYTSGGAAAPHVQIGVKDANGFYTTYSANNGNFWVRKNGNSVDWATADVRARNANGEVAMSSAAAAACNSCHNASLQIVAP